MRYGKNILIKKFFYLCRLVLLTFFLISGCSSLLPKEMRERGLSDFINQPQHFALFTPTDLKSEEKLKVFGVAHYGQKLSQEFHIKDPIVGVIKEFVASCPELAGTKIIKPDDASKRPLKLEEPVLFFHSVWRLIYRRLPPDFSMNQLQVGIAAKIIPLGQVLIGKGHIALRTAFWEGKCFYKAFNGRFIPLQGWLGRSKWQNTS